MNQIQLAIARVAGLDDVFESNEQRMAELQQAVEHTSSENALLVRQIEDLDYLNLFDMHQVIDIIPIADRKKHYNKLRRLRQENPLAKQSVKLITRFTLGNGVQVSIGPDPEKAPPTAADVDIDGEDPEEKGGAKLNGLFPGPRVNSSRQNAGLKPLARARPQVSEAVELDDEDQLKEIITSFWKDSDNEKAFTSHEAMKEWLDSVITDGEKFFVGFTAATPPYVRLTEIPVEEITDIIYSPDNRNVPVYYKRNFQPMKYTHDGGYALDGEPKVTYYLDYELTDEQIERAKESIKIEAKHLAPDDQRVFHTMINPLWTRKGKRGVSELYSSREWFRVYKEFMEDRAAINAAATSVAFKRKIKAGPTGVAQFNDKFGGVDVGYENPENNTELRKLTKPLAASVYNSNPAMDLDWMKTDTGAVNAKEDGRSLMAAAGAGVGIFVHYFGEGGDANLATAQAMELPMVKTFEDWQEWVNSTIRAMCRFVITIATDVENAKKQIDRVSGTFPPLISQDVVKFTTAWSQVAQNIAPGNRVVRSEAIRGALSVMRVPNIDSLMSRIEAEEVQVEIKRQEQQQQMAEALQQNSQMMNGEKPPGAPRNGSDQGLPPDLKTVAKGRPEPERNGPKPAR